MAVAIKRAVFTNGVLTGIYSGGRKKVMENRGIAVEEDCLIESDGVRYDLRNADQIMALPVPVFRHNEITTVLDLSYIMKMRCGKTEDAVLIVPFVEKTLALMIASPIGWRRGDYLQVIRSYYRLGLVKDGSAFEVLFRKNHPSLFASPYDKADEGEHLASKYYYEDKVHRHKEYDEVSKLFPKLAPKTVKGYLQIRTRKTEKFLSLKQSCEEKGMVFDSHDPFHYCGKKNEVVDVKLCYGKLRSEDRYDSLLSCMCEHFCSGACNGVNEYGLLCNYKR